jgi:hypothetical protein
MASGQLCSWRALEAVCPHTLLHSFDPQVSSVYKFGAGCPWPGDASSLMTSMASQQSDGMRFDAPITSRVLPYSCGPSQVCFGGPLPFKSPLEHNADSVTLKTSSRQHSEHLDGTGGLCLPLQQVNNDAVSCAGVSCIGFGKARSIPSKPFQSGVSTNKKCCMDVANQLTTGEMRRKRVWQKVTHALASIIGSGASVSSMCGLPKYLCNDQVGTMSPHVATQNVLRWLCVTHPAGTRSAVPPCTTFSMLAGQQRKASVCVQGSAALDLASPLWNSNDIFTLESSRGSLDFGTSLAYSFDDSASQTQSMPDADHDIAANGMAHDDRAVNAARLQAHLQHASFAVSASAAASVADSTSSVRFICHSTRGRQQLCAQGVASVMASLPIGSSNVQVCANHVGIVHREHACCP